MNKLVTVLGVAAVATLAGCKDPNYKSWTSQDDVKPVAPASCQCPPGMMHEVPCGCGAADCQCVVAPKPITPVQPSCKCAPGTKHTAPCACGTPDCKCIVEKPLPPPPPPAVTPVATPETTEYVVQPGDTLSKISKKYNIKIDAIKRTNALKTDVVRIGQKLKLPGKLDIVQPAAPVAATVAPKTVKKYEPYKGATKEYVVKSGDTLGAIAYGNGCNIRQLKELNGLSGDTVRVGQKLKVPAEKKAAVTGGDEGKKKDTPVDLKGNTKKESDKPVVDQKNSDGKDSAVGTKSDTAAGPSLDTSKPETPADDAATYLVGEGEDMTAVSIRFGVPAAAIRDLNNLPEDAQLTTGQIIKLPPEAQQ